MASQAVFYDLKAQNDPPRPGGPSKIQIACSAWDNQALHMPNKGEVIAEWILTRLFKDRAQINSQNPILDVRYWTLLSRILGQGSTTGNHWLLPVLNRVAVAPIFITFLRLIESVTDYTLPLLVSGVRHTFSVVWPVAAPKINAETLLELYGRYIECWSVAALRNDAVQAIGVSVMSAIRASASNSSNKKKLCTTFIQNYLSQWIQAVSEPSATQEPIFTTAVDILFSLDTLRQRHDEANALFVQLKALPHPDAVYAALPRLFAAFVQRTKRNRNALFGQGSSSGTQLSSAVSQQINASCFAFFDAARQILETGAPPATASRWQATSALLAVVRDENLFTAENQHNLSAIVPLVLQLLQSSSIQKGSASAVDCLSKLVEIDFSLVESYLSSIIAELLNNSDPSPPMFDFLQLCLDYHVKTRTLHDHVEILFAGLPKERVTEGPESEYLRKSRSAPLHPEYLSSFADAVSRFMTPTQIPHVITSVLAHVQSFLSDKLALTLSLSEGIASVVLVSLPMHTLSETVKSEAEQALAEFRTELLPKSISKALKHAQKSASWDSQVTAAALLRLLYALKGPPARKMRDMMFRALDEMPDMLPELRLEMLRVLLSWSAGDGSESPVGRALNYLKMNGGAWSGTLPHVPTALTENEAVLAVLWMLLDRWLLLVDAIGTADELTCLVQVLFSVPLDSGAGPIILSTLTSAEFWELPDIRTSLLAHVDRCTASQTSSDIGAVFRILAVIPAEYFPRSIRVELVRRAIVADMQSGLPVEDMSLSRQFVYNMLLLADHNLSDPLYLRHIVQQNIASSAKLSSVDQELIDILLVSSLKSSEADCSEHLVDLLRSCTPSTDKYTSALSQVLTKMVAVLIRDFSAASLPKIVQQALLDLRQAMLAACRADISRLHTHPELMDLWLQTVLLGRWLGQSDELMIGVKLCAAIGSPESVAVAFTILVEEYHATADKQARLGAVLAAYIKFFSYEDARPQLDDRLGQLIPALAVFDFSYCLELVFEFLETAELVVLPCLVHLAGLILDKHPPGTLKHTQKYLSDALAVFADRSEFTSGSLALRLEVLEFVKRHCYDHPASLRSQDVGEIWLLFAKFLCRSKERDAETTTRIFHDIVGATSALIRLRRDLVLGCLPNLTLVLQRLIAAMRGVRPQLGSKQTAAVTGTLPRWITAGSPLETEEAKALSRLLEGLVTKTTIRANSSHAEAQQAESLARPFSKHAAYVIQTYVHAMNDPLCILATDVRRELRPGLYALCSMINEHSRDAVTVSAFDAGGKTIMKTLWAEYEKQRYIGKG